ncbi:MAG: hypothetical protein ACTJIB_20715 [Pseudoalteromonas prydzensis]|uniref:Lipoprotein n=1 Tax=Pseudoalteromonas prydzensis TaxID=182141 RepID=A0ABR9FHL0_9GAMM|nr:hypothetical protein [Pseudoalteromonas prydzensis]MBE0456309.1 hypothetical protein [Pseudoalteromonas prydzensis]
MNIRTLKFPSLLLVLFLLLGCEPEIADGTVKYGKVNSPSGKIQAYVYEYNNEMGELTQVILDFPNGCGAGAVSAYKAGLDLELKWRDNQNLEVHYQQGINFGRNASGEIIQCYEYKVTVHLIETA